MLRWPQAFAGGFIHKAPFIVHRNALALVILTVSVCMCVCVCVCVGQRKSLDPFVNELFQLVSGYVFVACFEVQYGAVIAVHFGVIELFMSTGYLYVCVHLCGFLGYVVSIMGRRRSLPHIHSADWGARNQAERQAVNFVVQGV